MNVHISYKARKTPEVEREFQHQFEKLERRLHVFNPDLVHFHAIVDKAAIGTEFKIEVRRADRLHTFTIKLEKAPGKK